MTRRDKLGLRISDLLENELLDDVVPVLKTLLAFAIASSEENERARLRAVETIATQLLQDVVALGDEPYEETAAAALACSDDR